MHYLFTPQILEPETYIGGEEWQHCRVLRLREGETVVLVDGQGLKCRAELSFSGRSEGRFRILDRQTVPPPRLHRLTLLIAPTKQMERLEWCLEKVTEIGVDAIVPIICRRSERRQLRIDRLERVVQAAMKQSQQAWLPKVHEAVELEDWLKANPLTSTDQGLIAHCFDAVPPSILEQRAADKHVFIAIGPEGDFTPEEVAPALAGGWLPVNLGPTRLRTETAGVVAVTLLNWK